MTISIVLSSSNNAPTLEAAVHSIEKQDYPDVECIVVDHGSIDGSREILERHSKQLTVLYGTGQNDPATQLDLAFSRTSGEIMAWLNADEMLCPWACRLIATVFRSRHEVDWLTSGTPMIWSRSGLCVANGMADGYSKETFMTGRNLKSSSYFHHPIWRSGTFWTRDLWVRSGGNVTAGLDDAGDFELWARFWDSATLACVNLPISGFQAEAEAQRNSKSDHYWKAAAGILRQHGGHAAPSRLAISLRKWATQRISVLAPRLASRALYVWMAPETEECTMNWRYFV